MKKPKRVLVIAGCRNYKRGTTGIVKALKASGVKRHHVARIITGDATGVDKAAVAYAVHLDIDYQVYPADWDRYRRAAGPKRNTLMAKQGTMLLALWDGKSRGTRDMIEQATRHGLGVYIYPLRADDVR